jgi:Subtilase family
MGRAGRGQKAEQDAMSTFVDPYWKWAELTGGRYLLHDPSGRVRFLLELRDNYTIEDVTKLRGVNVLPTRAGGSGKFSSVWIDKPTTGKLEVLAPYAEVVLAEPGMRPVGELRSAGVDSNGKEAEKGGDELLAGEVVIGVIDGRCGFANKKFCSFGAAHESDIDYFWDQSTAPSEPWKPPRGFAYGRELDRAALSELLEQYVSTFGTRTEAEKALYAALGHDLPADADWSHGTHILDTVLTDYRSGTADADSQTARKRPGVVYVQLPDDALRDTSGRWAASYVLDALHYILDRVGAKTRVVVNLSLGSFAGPHDGSSMLERAIDELVKAHPQRLTVVVAAGNAGRVLDDGTGEPKACHARVTLCAGDGPRCDESRRSVDLEWVVDAEDSTESFMEIWVPELSAHEGKRASVVVTLEHRNGSTGEATEGPHIAEFPESRQILPNGAAVAASINATGAHVAPNGQGGMVLVALAHTRGAGQTCAPTGTWTVKVTNMSPFPITLDAWVERRDVPGELQGYRPQYGFSAETFGLTTKGSLGTVANGAHTIVVGAADWDQRADTYATSPYSSVGMAGISGDCNARRVVRSGPDIYGVGKREATGFLTGSKKGLAGTSMATAQVTAALAAAGVGASKGPGGAGRAGMLDSLSREAEARHERGGSKGPAPDGSGAPRLPAVDGRLSEPVLPLPRAVQNALTAKSAGPVAFAPTSVPATPATDR